MNPIVRLAAFVVLGAALIVPAPAVHAANQLIPGKIHIIKDTKLAKLVAKPVGPDFPIPAPLSSADPTVSGGSLNILDLGDGGGFSTTLPNSGWKGLGNPAGSKGYKYKGAGTLADPCKIVLVKGAVIKFTCKDDQALNPPLAGASAITLALGTDNYCAEFGGTEIKNVAGLLKRKDAPAPGSCAGISTTTTSTSSTTSSTFGPCCGGFTHGVFTSGPANGTCGTIKDFSGGTFGPVLCGDLYVGGGESSVPPAITPDLGQTVVELTGCSVQTATIAPTTSVQTGSNRNCSSPGCFFGGPLSIPNASTTATSTCVINTLRVAASGSVDCGLGTQNVSIPLDSEIFLTGDGATDPFDTIAGTQPCPLCSSNTCIGGPNDGQFCNPDDTNQGGTALGYPSSHDCPPDPMLSIGTIPINLALTTGAVSWTANAATNDTGSTVSNQTRVFCGYCRDKDGTGGFQQPFQQCWENGMALGPACTQPFESCEQRDQGAYGPGGQAVKTISVQGTPAGNVFDGASHAQNLVSNFCIPPTFDPTVDAAADLGGPGTLALTGTTELCSSPNPCPGP